MFSLIFIRFLGMKREKKGKNINIFDNYKYLNLRKGKEKKKLNIRNKKYRWINSCLFKKIILIRYNKIRLNIIRMLN